MEKRLASYKIQDMVAVVKIENPPLNALDLATKESLGKIFLELDDRRDDMRAVILCGSGEKAFAAGADIKTFLELKPDTAKRRLSRSHQIYSTIENFQWPVIAAIRGFCFGSGLELALCCDIRYGAESAKLGFPEVNLSIFPGNGGTQRAPHQMTLGKLKEIVYTGAVLDAREALQYGLLEKVVQDGKLMDETMHLASRIVGRGPLGVAAAKKVLNRTRGLSLPEGLELESDFWAGLADTEDMKEGAVAFLEKRKPKYLCR